jgi:hypothetical protein
MFRTTVVALVALLLSCSAVAQLTVRSSPADVEAAIRASDSRKVLSDLWQDDAAFGALLDHVDRGETKWFGVWLKLREHADGAVSESIDMAFARAIPRAPRSVLRLVGHGLRLNVVCTSPFIEPEPGVAEKYEREALHALSRVKDPDLKQVARDCAKGVRLPK